MAAHRAVSALAGRRVCRGPKCRQSGRLRAQAGLSVARVTPVRLVVLVGLLAITAGFVIDMSGSAPRIADSDHVSAPVFAATVPGRATVCQPVSGIPSQIGAVRLLVGSFGRPLPALNLRIVGAKNRLLAVGELSPGGREGYVSVPVRRVGDLSGATAACLHVGGVHPLALG